MYAYTHRCCIVAGAGKRVHTIIMAAIVEMRSVQEKCITLQIYRGRIIQTI